jgi:hypothetical protein
MSFFKKLFAKEPKRPTPEDLTPEFSQLIERSRGHLEALTSAHMGAWRFGEEENWDMNQDEGILRFHFKNGTLAEAAAQAIGSYNVAQRSWMWAWANKSIDMPLKQDSIRVRGLGEAKGIPLLTTPTWETDMEWVHNMGALATMHCDRQGAYFPTMGPMVFCLTFGEIKLTRHAPAPNG